MKKKCWYFLDFRSDSELDPDPYQNETDPQHCHNLFRGFSKFDYTLSSEVKTKKSSANVLCYDTAKRLFQTRVVFNFNKEIIAF